MATDVPLPTLLSQVLVAFTIEFDNESEHQLPHRTTTGGSGGAPRGTPWLVSQVMWANVMQYVDEGGVTVKEMHRRARTRRDSLAGLQRWGYVVVAPDPKYAGSGPAEGELVVRPTVAGRRAQRIWRPLAALVEQRWLGRFGADDIATLRACLQSVVDQIDAELPQYLPIVYPTMSRAAEIPRPKSPNGATKPPDLSALLSQVLLAFTLDFEQNSNISLPVGANTLRVVTDAAVRLRDLPQLTGVSTEANQMAVGFLERRGFVVVEPDPSASRGKQVRLTGKGQVAQDRYHEVLAATEARWMERFAAADLADLRFALERLVGDPAGGDSPLLAGLEPYPDGWRASRRRIKTLPHYPMVLHRGGYPDGS